MHITMPQHEGVLGIVWACYKILPLALRTLKCALRRQIGKPVLSELCLIS